MRIDILEDLLVGSIAIGPLLFLLASWRLRVLPDVRKDRVLLSSLFITLISYLLLAAALLFHDAIGEDYSSRRYLTVVANCAAGAVSSIVFVTKRKRTGWTLAISAILLSLVWLIVGAASSAG
jgi:hypothetical protein